MPKLCELKERLEKLPSLRAEKHLEGRFAKYCHDLSEHHRSLRRAHDDMESILKVEADPEFEKKVLGEIKKAVKEAKKVHKEIEEKAEVVKNKSTENSVIRIKDSATKANGLCSDHWSKSTEDPYPRITNVVEKLPNKRGKEYKNAVDRLGRKSIPRTTEEVQEVKELKEAVRNGVTKLGLKGPAGKFLEASAFDGASLSDVKKPEIKLWLDENDLWDSFVVRLK